MGRHKSSSVRSHRAPRTPRVTGNSVGHFGSGGPFFATLALAVLVGFALFYFATQG